MSVDVGNNIKKIDYKSIKDKVDSVFGKGSGTYGYGQPVTSLAIETGDIITKQQWMSLRNDMIKIRQHQTGRIIINGESLDGFSLRDISISEKISASITSQYDTFADILINDRFTISDTQMTAATIVDGQRNIPWKDKITHNIEIQGAVGGDGIQENLRYFFNAGGKLKISAAREGSIDTDKNKLWSNLLSTIGNIYIGNTSTVNDGNSGHGSSIGWNDLTSSYKQMFTSAAEGTVVSPAINIMFILDVSDDMNNYATYGDTSIQKLQALKNVTKQLIQQCVNAVDDSANVKVRLVKFSNHATHILNSWIDVYIAEEYIDGLQIEDIATNNDLLSVATNSFNTPGKLHGSNVIYVVTGNNSLDIDEQSWKTFLNNNKILSHALWFNNVTPNSFSFPEHSRTQSNMEYSSDIIEVIGLTPGSTIKVIASGHNSAKVDVGTSTLSNLPDKEKIVIASSTGTIKVRAYLTSTYDITETLVCTVTINGKYADYKVI